LQVYAKAHHHPELTGRTIWEVFEAERVGMAHDDHIARGVVPSPAHRPEVETVVQVDIGKER
jgi:hypothetical protein